MSTSFTLSGGLVLCGTPPRLQELDVVVSEGRITELIARPHEFRAVDPPIDVSGRLVLPGLINGHTHSYGQVCRHLAVDGRLEEWMPRALIAGGALDSSALRLAAKLNALDNLRHGVTASLDHASLPAEALQEVVEGYDEVGARVVLALQVSDRPATEWLPSLDPGDRFAVHLRRQLPPPASAAELSARTKQLVEIVSGRSRITAQVGPSAPDRCTPRLLDQLSETAHEHGLGIHTHLAETELQSQTDGIETLQQHQLLGARTTVAHAIHLNRHDRERLARAAVTVVHDPLCNLLLGSGSAQLDEFVRAGITVGLGTDGWPTGGAQDILAQARVALGVSRTRAPSSEWLKPVDMLAMLGFGSASALGLETVIGQIAIGYKADLLIVDPVRANWLTAADPADQLILGGLSAGLESVFVDGIMVLHDGRPTLLDAERIAAEANALAAPPPIVSALAGLVA
jgi:cytosine/adenosine deaminase-related metal-dependent hydrolase